MVDHKVRQVGSDAHLVEFAFLKGTEMESARIGHGRKKRIPSKHRSENSKGMQAQLAMGLIVLMTSARVIAVNPAKVPSPPS